MVDFINVSDYTDWKIFVDDFLSRHSDRNLVFRGQNRDMPFVSSMRRIIENSEHVDVPLTTFNWETLILRALEEVGVKARLFPRDKYRLIGMAVLQHYGYRSWFIDVTKAPEIALWFSLNKHSKTTTFILKEEDSGFHPCLYVPTSYYEPTDLPESYFYIIDVTDYEDLYFDLTRYVPKKAIRVHSQNAGAIFEPDDKSFDDLLAAKIKLNGDIMKYSFAEKYTYNSLFPSFEKDYFYRFLLTLPYFVPTDHATKHMAPAFPIVPVPFYKHEELEVFDFAPMIKVLTIPSFFPVENGMIGGLRLDKEICCTVNGRKFKFREALQILPPQYPSKKPTYLFQIPEFEAQSHPSTSDQRQEKTLGSVNHSLAVWPSNNLIVMFPLSPLFLPLGESKDEFLPKGLWIIFDADEIYIARFGFEGLALVTEAGMHFVRKGKLYQVLKRKGDCSCGDLNLHQNYLYFFLLISHFIESGRWSIGPSCLGHRHLIQKI